MANACCSLDAIPHADTMQGYPGPELDLKGSCSLEGRACVAQVALRYEKK
jgi:hypothetical protein